MLSASGPIQKAGGGGGGGGAWVCAVHLIQAQYERREGCVAEEGEVPYNLLNIPLIINDFIGPDLEAPPSQKSWIRH